MATMTHRTTFALDDATMLRIKNLANLWKVSQAEVVRRAVAGALTPATPSSPAAALQHFIQAGKGLDKEIADQYLREVRTSRKLWRGE